MNHRVRSVLAAVLIMVVSILLPSDFQFENTDRFVKEQSSSIQMTAPVSYTHLRAHET